MIQAFAGYTVAHAVREDDQFVLLRATRDADGAPVLVLCARHERGTALARIEHEYALRAELDPAWAATPLALFPGAAAPALVLADSAAAPLQILQITPGQPLAPARLVQLGAAIAHALAQLHGRHIVHRDLRPEHILIDCAGAVRLTGFGIATRLGALPQLPEDQISGSLAYMAPEQTGRMNRAVDTRADLYGLGVLLYQLLCGELPYQAADPMQWIHCHVARAAPAPTERCPGADPTLSAIVLKLLSKTAEQRYQSAAGLYADLQHCQAMLAQHGAITPFALAGSDSPARLQVPASLVGRAAQLAVLESAVRQVAAGAGPEMVMLSGLAGTGKSALLAALQQSSAATGVLVLAAKCAQRGRDIPYATLAGAVRELVRRMLGQSDAALDAWRSKLPAALGSEAARMRRLIPELGFVISADDCADAAHGSPALAPPEAQARFHHAFRRLLGTFAASDSMLLLCLDDLQWIDPASLKFLVHLLTHPDVRRVCLAGACRAGAADGPQPLALAQDAMRRLGTTVREVVLGPLTRSEAAELVAAALDCPVDACAPLAALVFGKSAGNPFFTLQFLTRLLESGLLRHRPGSNCWEWDAAAISARQFSDNVIDLMVARLQQLPYSTLEVIKLLACLGPDAGLDTLALAAGMSSMEADENLWPAARLGLVLRDAHAYRFTHDRVQEAAYSLIARASLPERHLHLGRLLLARLDAEGEGEIFTVVGHLNLAREAIDDPAELAQLAGLNAQAGARARASVAYEAARHYYQSAAALTASEAWQQAPGPSFKLYSALAEAEYLCGHLERSDSLLALLDTHARSRLELAQVALMRLALYQVWGRFDQAVAVALESLARFGISFPEGDAALADALAAERAAVPANLAGRSMAELEREAPGADPELAIVAELLTDMGSSVFSARPHLYPLLALKALNFTLRFGASASACVTYSRYAVLQVSLGAIPEAFAYSQLALGLAGRGGASQRRAGRLRFVHGAYVHPWRRPVAHSVALLEQASSACQEAGDLPHAGYAAHNATWASFEAGEPLHAVQARARQYQQLARQHNNELLMQLLRCYEQLTLCLQGATGSEASLDDARFTGAEALAQIEQGGFGAARARFFLMRQVAAFTFGRHQEALDAAEAAGRERHFLLASVAECTHYFYHALCMTALYPDAPPERQARFMAALHEIAGKLRAWAGHCPGNFDNRYLLVMAELARIGGRAPEAQRAYSAALASARTGGFVHNEALAAELAARFYAARGADQPALAYARDALQACARWGAYGKMRQLEREFPGLVRVPAPLPGALQAAAGPAHLPLGRPAPPASPLASTFDPSLAQDLLGAAIELAGAGRGLLLLPEADGYRCAAEGWADADGVHVRSGPQLARPAAGAALPQTLIQFVLRTHETVLLDDAQESGQFAGDPYLQATGARSVLCMVLALPGASAAVLYLDNALAPGLFTTLQVGILEQLAASAGSDAQVPMPAEFP